MKAEETEQHMRSNTNSASLAKAAREPLIGDWSPELELDGATKYLAIATTVEQGIKDGVLLPGMRLPPQRDIANYFDVTIATVTKAISVAMRKGLVLTRAGSGTFIAEQSPPPSAAPSNKQTSTQDLSLNAPPASIASEILRANLQELAGAGFGTGLFDYEPIPGATPHRQAGAKWLSLRGLHTSPDNIFVTQGAHEALLTTLSALTQPGDTVLCERLNYTGLKRIGQLLHINLIGVDIDDDGLCVDALPGLIQQHQPKAIICTPVIHNPTTATLSEERKALLVDCARSTNTIIIEDDIYGLFKGNSAPPIATRWPEGTVLITSLSKTIAAGLRIGYLNAPNHLIPRLRDAMFSLGWTAPLLQMSFATRLIESGRAEQCLELQREEANKRVQLAKHILGDSLCTSTDTPTYHVWVETGTRRPGDIAAELYREGIQVSPASHFLVGEGQAPHALRLSLGRAESCLALKLPLKLIAHRLSVGHAWALGSIA